MIFYYVFSTAVEDLQTNLLWALVKLFMLTETRLRLNAVLYQHAAHSKDTVSIELTAHKTRCKAIIFHT